MARPITVWNEQQLREGIRSMRSHQLLYKILSQELRRLGKWKEARKGKPFLVGPDSRKFVDDEDNKKSKKSSYSRREYKDNLANKLTGSHAERFRTLTEPEPDYEANFQEQEDSF